MDASLIEDCVHCGFCLPSCPTYVLWGEEMDSPRGRIHLMSQALQNGGMDAATVTHIDQCLGCMACVTACPSGVRYGTLIEQTRAEVERSFARPAGSRAVRAAVFALFPYPRRLRALRAPLRAYQRSRLSHVVRRSGLLRRLPPTVGAMEELLPDLSVVEPVPAFTPAQGPRRARVALVLGCVQREFFPGVNAATARVLAAEGCDVLAPPTQGCCGALSLHAGRAPQFRRLARRFVEAYDVLDVDYVVVNAAGCGASLKEYGELLADDPVWGQRARALAAKVRDVSELLAELGPVAPRRPLPVSIAYHDACHLAHAQGIRSAPRELLTAIPGVELREIAEGELCCGSAGVYNILQPGAARELGERKARNVVATGAQLLVTANPGCLMQIAAALRRAGGFIPMAHTVQVLDAAISGTPLRGLPLPMTPSETAARSG